MAEAAKRLGPEAMAGHLFLGYSHAPHHGKNGVTTHAPRTRERVAPAFGKGAQLVQDNYGLAGKGHDMGHIGQSVDSCQTAFWPYHQAWRYES